MMMFIRFMKKVKQPKGFKLIDEVYGDDCESVSVGYSFQKWVKVE